MLSFCIYVCAVVYKNLYIFYTSTDCGDMKGIITKKTYLVHVS